MNIHVPNKDPSSGQSRARKRSAQTDPAKEHDRAIIEFLRAMVLGRTGTDEHFHAVFVDDQRAYLGDAPLGYGSKGHLMLRMRDLFGFALHVNARGMLIAHNHPSGLCRPSEIDIEATAKLRSVAEALDIELLDHLIFTQSAVYSMRAGGKL